jgi:hypothetical protein
MRIDTDAMSVDIDRLSHFLHAQHRSLVVCKLVSRPEARQLSRTPSCSAKGQSLHF